jgi:hypothetical protein
MANTWDVGDNIVIENTYTTGTPPAAVDPTSLTLKIKLPNKTEVSYELGVDEELVKDAVGIYHVDYLLTLPGQYWYHWLAVFTEDQTADEKYFLARQTSF